MKIGVDGSCWTNKRGYGRYTRELVRALLQVDTRNQYRLFLDAQTAQQCHDLPFSGIELVVVETSQAAGAAASAAGNRSLRDLWAMGRAVQRDGRDLDLFYFPSVFTYFPVRTRARIVVTIHDTIPERFPALIFPNQRARLFWRLKVAAAVRQADAILTVSTASRRAIAQRLHVREDDVRVVPDAVNGHFGPVDDRRVARQTLARFGVTDHEQVVLYVGGISPHKNLTTLVTAYAGLVNTGAFADTRLVLVGDYATDGFYSGYAALRDQIAAAGLTERVIFTGYLSDADLLQVYNAADVFVLPSLDEGFGLPALEAMVCGVPVVASRAGALPDVVGEAGRLFDPYSTAELTQCLTDLLGDAEARRELGRQGRERARTFTWDRAAQAALAAFEAVAHRE